MNKPVTGKVTVHVQVPEGLAVSSKEQRVVGTCAKDSRRRPCRVARSTKGKLPGPKLCYANGEAEGAAVIQQLWQIWKKASVSVLIIPVCLTISSVSVGEFPDSPRKNIHSTMAVLSLVYISCIIVIQIYLALI